MIEPIPATEVARKTKPSNLTFRGSISRPADPTAPSILTSFAPEIRNSIYEYLYEKDEPVLYNNRWRREWSSRDDHSFSDHYEILGLADPNPPRSENALLLACKQIYEEAVGILYGRNTFLISVPPKNSRHAIDQCLGTAHFLREIGSQFQYIRRVEINANVLFQCNSWIQEDVDILPVVRIMWLNPRLVGNILFTHTGCVPNRRRNFRGYTTPRLVGDEDASNAEFLNRVLDEFVVADTLGIKKYGRFERIIAHIWIRHDLCKGQVVFHSSKRLKWSSLMPPINVKKYKYYGNDNAPWFRIDRKTRKLKWDRPLNSLVSYHGSRYCLNLIIEHGFYGSRETIFDLDSRTATNFNIWLLGLDVKARRGLKAYFRQTQLGLLMTTDQPHTDFSEFDSLDKWKEEEISNLFPRRTHYGPINLPNHFVVLQFNVAAKALSDLRINVKHFVLSTHNFSPKCMVCFRLSNLQDDSQPPIEHKISLLALRQRLALLINHCLLNDMSLRRPHELPEMWIDGYGKIIEAIYPANDTSPEERILNPYANLDGEDTIKVGQELFGKFLSLNDHEAISHVTVDGVPPVKDEKSLYSMWALLRELDWGPRQDD